MLITYLGNWHTSATENSQKFNLDTININDVIVKLVTAKSNLKTKNLFNRILILLNGILIEKIYRYLGFNVQQVAFE